MMMDNCMLSRWVLKCRAYPITSQHVICSRWKIETRASAMFWWYPAVYLVPNDLWQLGGMWNIIAIFVYQSYLILIPRKTGACWVEPVKKRRVTPLSKGQFETGEPSEETWRYSRPGPFQEKGRCLTKCNKNFLILWTISLFIGNMGSQWGKHVPKMTVPRQIALPAASAHLKLPCLIASLRGYAKGKGILGETNWQRDEDIYKRRHYTWYLEDPESLQL